MFARSGPRFRRLKPSCSPKSFVDSTYQRYNRFFHPVHKELLYFPNLDPQVCTPAHQNSVSRCPCHECKLPLLARPVLDYCYRIPFVHFLHVEQGTSIQGCIFVFDLALATVSLKQAGKCFQPTLYDVHIWEERVYKLFNMSTVSKIDGIRRTVWDRHFPMVQTIIDFIML